MSYISLAGATSSGGVLGPVVPAPPTSTSPGTPYEIAFDAAGNLYIAIGVNQWAKYANIFPPPVTPQDAQPLGMP